MYIPEPYRIKKDAELLSFVSKWNFADVITVSNGKLMSNKIPLYVDIENSVIYGHLGSANEQVSLLETADDLMVIFSGLHSYISPQWYESDDSVPTWNFETVQVKGKASLVDDDGLIGILEKLTAKHEQSCDNPWTMENLEPNRLGMMLKVIRGFKIDIEQIEGKRKFSQNRNSADRQGVIKALKNQDDDMSIEMATAMQQQLSSNS